MIVVARTKSVAPSTRVLRRSSTGLMFPLTAVVPSYQALSLARHGRLGGLCFYIPQIHHGRGRYYGVLRDGHRLANQAQQEGYPK